MTDISPRLELGLGTFGDVSNDAHGRPEAMDKVLRDVVAQAVLADQVGIDFIGLGEHHRPDFAISSPEVILGAIAGQTRQIRFGSAVTVLSSDDPVRVFQRFSSLNAVSDGRAEVILGRGSFSESYALFGYDMADYDQLFEEKLDLFAKLLRDKAVTWQGQTRSALSRQVVYPPLGQQGLTTWVGVGGSPESVVRVVRQDLRLMLAIIGGDPRRFQPYVDLYHRSAAKLGRSPKPIGVHSPGFIAATDEEARESLWPHYKAMFGRIGRERGWPHVTKDRYLDEIAHGSLYVGSPETVARKLAAMIKALRIDRFDMKYATGPQSHDDLMRCIQLYGEKVVPMVQDMLATDRV